MVKVMNYVNWTEKKLFFSIWLVSADDGILGGEKIPVTETKVLEMIESAYPNPLTLNDIFK